MEHKKDRLHRFDSPTLIKALLIGVLLETAAFLPAVLSPWGHAGPESLWGWIGLLLNLPGLCVAWFLAKASGVEQFSSLTYMVVAYSVQSLGLAYIAFVCLRVKNRRTKSRVNAGHLPKSEEWQV